MRVLMLGWEFPPFITGGLGTACHGLTHALDSHGVQVAFVLPTAIDRSAASHVDLLSPDMPIPLPSPQHVAATAQDTSPHPRSSEQSSTTTPVPVTPSVATPTPRDGNTGPQDVADDPTDTFSDGIDFVRIPSRLVHPYDPSQSGVPVGEVGNSPPPQKRRTAAAPNESAPTWTPSQGPDANQPDHAECHEDLIQDELHDELVEEEHPSDDAGTDYAGDMMSEVRRFASFATRAASSRQFDIIHAHDWMTYPAGLAVARRSGRPLVVHVHSTEFDRSGEHVNQQIYDIERRGMHGAMRVMTVSRLTRDIVIRRYGVDPRKVTVVYNGVAIDPHEQGIKPIGRREKIILYFGRITRQKGPEFFIRAAARVLEVEDNVRFVVAGSGDLYQKCIDLAASLGIGQHFVFTGFLRGADIDKVFAMADLFVMPSISEPFGIAPLEAMSHDVPVLISRTSGASEVLSHVLKCDFWDTEAMADRMVAVLRHPPLQQTLRREGVIDVRRLTWDDAAAKCETVYEEVVEAMQAH